MQYFHKYAAALSVDAIRDCLGGEQSITHLITVSCTGMSAPGLDIQIVEMLDLPKNTWRTSINFMGCYAAIHALKIADSIASHDRHARVMIVCTELCTLHFQHEPTTDNISSALLFGDGSAAALVCHDDVAADGVKIKGFYGEVMPKGKRDMAWELSSSGFLMTLSGYVPELISADFSPFVEKAMDAAGVDKISRWCIHPGGKRILQAIEKSLLLPNTELSHAYDVLREYGNMSSATILFVLKRHMQDKKKQGNIFGAAFGPGLTMESFVAHA